MTDASSQKAPFEYFEAASDAIHNTVAGDAIVHVPSRISNAQALRQVFAKQLDCSTQGRNWDAFREDLLDLNWLTETPSQIWIVHDDLPFPSARRSRLIYLSILGDCVLHSRSPIFRVCFPRIHEAVIQQLWRERL